MEQRWYSKKSEIPDSKWIISKDVGENGCKNFTYFKHYDDYINFLEENKGGSYYEIIKKVDDPVFMFFDIDLPHVEDNTVRVVDVLLDTLSHMLNDKYGVEVDWKIGTNCQIATASTKIKCSIHFIGYILFPSVEHHKSFTINLVEYISDKNIKELMYNRGGVVKTAIDHTIYTNFRSYRCVHMTKIGKDNFLIPYKCSSIKIKDHLVNYVKEYSTVPLHTIVDTSIKISKSVNEVKTLVNFEDVTKSSIDIGEHSAEYMTAINFIKSNQSILEKLQTTDFNVSNVYFREPCFFDMCIKNKQGCNPVICPIANRHHKHNNVYIRYISNTRQMIIYCYDEECKDKKQCCITNYTTNVVLKDVFETKNITSLHTHEDIIQWDEVYNEPVMRDYPLRDIVCIRGGMGLGKTVTLKKLIKDNFTEETSALIVTFSRSLARKYASELGDQGFVNYLSIKNGPIFDQKVIVCLDSLWRITMRNPKFVLIDEALSVFLHFNSPLMKDTGNIAILLELLIFQAKHVYFLDACVDHVFMYNVIDYFSKLKNTTPYWIYNKFIRETNRTVDLYIETGNSSNRTASCNPLSYNSILHICSLLRDKKKVVVCSSTKGFTKTLEASLKTLFPDIKMGVYNSETTKGLINELGDNINTDVWAEYDILVYSPSITAGISFEKLHFDVLVGYLVNSVYTPTIDITIQQLFRVRKLREGKMSLYIYNQLPNMEIPVYEEEIENFLHPDNSLTVKHYNSNISISLDSHSKIRDGNHLRYDKSRLSYQILKCITILNHRSNKYYVETLINTLKKDYNIPIQEKQVDVCKEDVQFIEEAEDKITSKLPIFDKNYIITKEDYQYLLTLENLSPLQEIQKRVYVIAKSIWNIEDDKIDEEFYETYIKPSEAFEISYAAQRFYRAGRHTYNELCRQYKDKLKLVERSMKICHYDVDKPVVKKDLNMYTFLERKRNYYVKTLNGMLLLNSMFSEMEWKKAFVDYSEIIITEEKLKEKYSKFKNNLSEDEMNNLINIYNINKKSAELTIVNNILRNTFNVALKRKHQNNTKKGYTDLRIKTGTYQHVFDKYNPQFCGV